MHLVDQDVPGPKRDFIGYGRRLPKVFWPNDAKLALNLIVNYEEGSEYSIPAGDNRNEGLAEIPYAMPPECRDLNAESVYEFGARAGVMRLLRLFDEYDLKVTFYAAAVAVERNREVGEWIREAQHEPAAHGWRWIDQSTLELEEERAQIEAAVRSLEETCGERPVGWFSRYSASVNTRALLVEEGGFLYDSDAFNDDLPHFTQVNGKRHLIVPYTLLYNDGRYVLPQGFGGPRDFFDTCKAGLDELLREGRRGYPKMMSIGLHPRWAGQAARTAPLRQFIEYAQGQGDVWFARRRDIAEWWIEHHEQFGANSSDVS
jgi:peptidoglycan/xylan/chitin deacetylase (PgdA/CDA1 family)